MARGVVSKDIITKKILETFDGSFIYGKEIRIPIVEDGTVLQIKVTLTAAKENVEVGGDVAVPKANVAPISDEGPGLPWSESSAPSAEEKASVSELLKNLGLA